MFHSTDRELLEVDRQGLCLSGQVSEKSAAELGSLEQDERAKQAPFSTEPMHHCLLSKRELISVLSLMRSTSV